MSTAIKTKPSLWAKAKADAKSRMGGKHSARAMQLAVKLYKQRGGGYKGAKSSANKLSKWSKQDWTTSSGKPSEGKEDICQRLHGVHSVQHRKQQPTEQNLKVINQENSLLNNLNQ